MTTLYFISSDFIFDIFYRKVMDKVCNIIKLFCIIGIIYTRPMFDGILLELGHVDPDDISK